MPDPRPPQSDSPALDPLWVEGRLRLCHRSPGGSRQRVLPLARPFVLIGRGVGADVCINDPEASTRHVYLHLDRRGLFGVDLATRGGTRFRGAPRAAAWLRPGDTFEIAGHEIEVLEAQTEPVGLEALAAGRPDPLEESDDPSLTGLTLFPHQAPWEPQDASSELLFLGRGTHCAICLEGESIARVHAVLVRSTSGVYVVDFSGGRTRINDRPVPRAAALRDGDVLAMGSAQFEARVRRPEPIAAVRPDAGRSVSGDRTGPTSTMEIELAQALPIPREGSSWNLPDLPAPLPAEAQGAVLAWLVQAVQAGQGEALRRQGEFQQALTGMVRQICLDNAAMLHEHLQRMEAINSELSGLREEIRRRFGAAMPTPPPTAPPPPPLRIAPVEPPTDPEQSTSWLMDRVQRLEEENRSTWRDLLGRLGGQNRQAP